MSKYYRHFGLERDPFLDTADPYFYCEAVSSRRAKARLVAAVEQSRGLTVVIGDPGTGKTSLCGSVEQDLMRMESIVLGKILDPTFASDVEFLIALGRVFGLSLPPRSSAALKNALKNFFFDTAVLENRTLVLIVDEAQNLSDDGLETLRLLLNYHIPQKKLLNIVLFGQSELEGRVVARQNLADRVDSWLRLEPLDAAMAQTLLEFRLGRAGLAPGIKVFSPEALDLIVRSSGGLPRRLTTLAHTAMVEAAERGSSGVFEEHAVSAVRSRGASLGPPLPKHENGHVDGSAAPATPEGGPVARWWRKFAGRL